MNYYLVSWDCHGVETFVNITDWHPDRWAEANLFDSIREGKIQSKAFPVNVSALLLRARFNTQRNYEVYVFTADDTVEESEIKLWFEQDPQAFVDWVRENHSSKLWDDRARPKDRVIV